MTSWGYSVGGSQLLWRKPPHPRGSRKDKHSSSSEDVSYSGPAPGTPSLGWPNSINIPLPASVLLLPPRRKHFHRLHSSTVGNHPRRIMRAKSRDLANVQDARRIVDLSLAPWALVLSSGKMGKFPAGYSLPFPLDPLHHSPPNRHTSRAK